MKRYTHIFVYGFAIFSMFFGSGNLVFPLQIGQNSGSQWLLGFIGLFLTGIFLPFLGLFVIKMHRGSYAAFFGEAGSFARLSLPFFTLSLLGPFGVVPRCITVAYGGVEPFFPEISLGMFSLLFSGICFLVCIKEHFMMTVLGKGMSPLLLLCLSILIGLGVIYAPPLVEMSITAPQALQEGFLRGYFTMDLFAAFFFSALIFNQLQEKVQTTNDREVLKAAIKASSFGCCLLTFIYLGFVFLGAHFTALTATVAPELILPTIASHLMGKYAGVFIGIIILFSCLTTAVALNSIYARYLCEVLNFKKEKFLGALALTAAVSFGFSLLNFQGISAILSPILEISYPSIIGLTIMSIFIKDHKKIKMFLFYGILIISLGWMMVS